MKRVQESLFSGTLFVSGLARAAGGTEGGTRLDVILPRLLQEESDPFVVLELVEQDQLDACVYRLSGGEVFSSGAKRDSAPPGVSQTETVHSWNLSIDLRYLCCDWLSQRLSKAQDCTKSIQDSHCAVGPLDVLDDVEAGVSDELHDMSSVRSRLLSVADRRPAASCSSSGHGGCIGRGTALRCAKDGERSRDGGRVYAEVRTRGRGGRCRCGRGRFARCEGGFVQRIVERADEDCDQVGAEGRTGSASSGRTEAQLPGLHTQVVAHL